MSNYITLGLNIALALFIGFGIIFGLIRGLRKTASRGIFLVITSIILLFVTIPIANALLKIKINTDFTIEESTLTGAHSIEECIVFFVKAFLGEDFSAKNPEFVSVITALPLVFVNAVVYLILFVVCKYLLLPLNHLFYKLTFAPRKPKESFGFSSFDDDIDFDAVEKKLAQKNIESKDAEIEKNDIISSDNIINESVDQTLNTAEPVPNADTENSNVESVSVNTPKVDRNLDYRQALDKCAEEHNAPTDGLFIKNEIEEPKIERVVADDFDKPIKEKKHKVKKEKIKVKKHRLLGGLVGALVGMFVMINVCMPVYGMMNIVKDIEDVQVKNLSEEEINLNDKTNGVSNEIITAYDNSIFYPVSKYLGMEGISLAEFDMLTSKTINNKKVKLRSDIKSLAQTIVYADNLVGKYKNYTAEGSIGALTQDQVNTLLTDANQLLEYAKKVNLVDCVADYIIPVACSLLINSNKQISEDPVINALAIDAIKTLAEANDINVFDETCRLIDLATYLNNQGLLTRILQGNFSDPIAIIKGLDDDFGSTFTTKLFNLQTVSITMPYLLNIGLNFLEKSINYGYVENDYTQSVEDFKKSISNFVNEAVATIKSIDTNSSIYITTKSLEPLGNLLQTVKVSGIVNTQTYTNLIDYAIAKLQDVLSGLVPDDLNDYLINEFVANIAKVDRWDEEMRKISSAITQLRDVNDGILGDVVEGENLRQGTSINIGMKQSVFDNLGKSLDILEGTVLFGAVTNKTIDSTSYSVSGTISLFSSLLDYASTTIKNDVTDSSLHKITDVISDLKTNLITSRHTYNAENEFWSYELGNVAPLVIELYDMLQSGNFDVTIALGKGLDKAKNTTLFANDATLKFMDKALDIVKDSILGTEYTYNNGSDTSKPQVLNDKIYELFSAVSANLNLNATKDRVRLDSKFWETEFAYYKNLKNIAENATKLNTISDAKALAEDLDNVMSSYTIPQEEMFSIVSFAIKDIKSDGTSDVDIAINTLIDKIASRLNTTYLMGKDLKGFWQIEFDHLSNLMDIKFTDDGDYKIKNNLKNIGIELDKVVMGYTIADDPTTPDLNENKNIRASFILTSDDLRDVLGSAIPEVKNSISSSFDASIRSYIISALTSIQNNIEDTTNITNISFTKELTHLQTLANLHIDSSILTYPTGTDTEIQAQLELNRLKLNALGLELDSIAYAMKYVDGVYKYTDVINANESTNSKFVTRAIIGNLIRNVFDISKADVSAIPANPDDRTSDDKEKLAFNQLIDNIQSQILHITSNNQIMSWQRELGFVNALVKLNGGVNYNISNVATNVGSNLDLLAFNLNSSSSGQTFDDVVYNSSLDCTYIPSKTESGEYLGNSLFVTRESIITLMSSYLSRVKETISAEDDEITKEQKNLVNSIIDNTTSTIATQNAEIMDNNYYNNFHDCLSELTAIKEDIDSKLDMVSGGSSALTEENARQIDELLNNYQTKPLLAILLTRRMANLILHKIGVPSNTLTGIPVIDDAINYYNDLENYYKTRNNNSNDTDMEYYYTTDTVDASYFPNPFVNLYNKINATI